MKMYQNGGKTTQQDQTLWGKVHQRLSAAKEKAQIRFTEYTTGNDRKINGAALKAAAALMATGGAELLRQASFSMSNVNNFAGAVGSVAAMGEATGVAAAAFLTWYAVEHRHQSKLYNDLRAGFKNSRDKLSAGVKKVISGHLNKDSKALNSIIQSRKARAQG